mgnify:FL=1|tara:strand:- start:157 stop:543 length:387 start_codon:yes stop_codon:yes gene_type:complete
MAYNNTKEFCKGLYFTETDLTKNIETSEKQFIFFKVSIRKKELIEYLESQNSDDDWINISVKRSRTNKFYGEVDTYRKREDKPVESNRSGSNDYEKASEYIKDYQQQNKKNEWESKKESQSYEDEIPF